MSGGSYDYAYGKVNDFADDLALHSRDYPEQKVLRTAFEALLRDVSAAMRAIEWNDSGDGDHREKELLGKLVGCREYMAQGALAVFRGILPTVEEAAAALRLLGKEIDAKA